MPKQMTAITQIHAYIKEHYRPEDVVSRRDIKPNMKWLTDSSISSSLWKLATEDILIDLDECAESGAKKYMVSEIYLEERGFEDREAPEPGRPRHRKPKKRKL